MARTFLAFFVILTACDTTLLPADSRGCTEMAVPSVRVLVEDEAGEPVEAAEVWWSVDGGEPKLASCGAPEGCSGWIAGWEVAGDFTITVDFLEPAAQGCCWFEDQVEVEVTVAFGPDFCHVQTEEVTVVVDTGIEVCPDVC